jgi:hypothetical protein
LRRSRIVASLSLIAFPSTTCVRRSAAARTGGGSVLVGLGHGSVNLFRGITAGSHKSLVRLANSLDATITASSTAGRRYAASDAGSST